jgi:hypothetical protein
MNTPAHAVINLLLLSSKRGHKPSHRRSAAIVFGALLPDLAIMVFYAWQLILGRSESQIWTVEYYRPFWQACIDSFNSIPLILLAMLLCWRARRYLLLALFSSMLLHVLGDLPLHHDDAHRHFWPFSDWRFASPVSYWDPAHYGRWASLLEFIAVFAAAAFMFRRHAVLRPWVTVLTAVYLLYWIYVLVVWA